MTTSRIDAAANEAAGDGKRSPSPAQNDREPVMPATCRFEAGQLVRLVRTIELFGGDVTAGSTGVVRDAWIEHRGELLNVEFGPQRSVVVCALTADDVEAIEARAPHVPTAPAPAKRRRNKSAYATDGMLWPIPQPERDDA